MLGGDVGKSFEHASRWPTAFLKPGNLAIRSQNEGRFMPRAAIFQATARNVEHARKDGYEQGLGILPRDFSVGFTKQFSDPTPASKGSTFAQSFADRHEDAGRQALP